MPVENTTNIAGLDASQPPGTALKSEGDDHLRLLKDVLRHAFAGFAGEVLLAANEAQGATVNDYALTLSPAPAAYAANTIVVFRATHANTGAATLRLSALSVVPLLNPEGTALRRNAILASTLCVAIFDGTNFRLLVGSSQTPYDYANQLAFSTALPSMAGHENGMLVTDGQIASWKEISEVLAKEFASEEGVQELPNGTIFRCGYSQGTGDFFTFFPLAFPRRCLAVVCTPVGIPPENQQFTLSVRDLGPAGFNTANRLINPGSVGGVNAGFYYIAWGE